MISGSEIDRRFDLHKPKPEDGERLDFVREILKNAADQINANTPACREQSLAITALEEALYWSVASIVRPDAIGRRL
jgi:hypothetical protein